MCYQYDIKTDFVSHCNIKLATLVLQLVTALLVYCLYFVVTTYFLFMFTVVLPSVMCKISRPNKSQSIDCDFAIFVARYITYLHHSSFYQKHRLSFHIVTPLVTINHYNPLGYVSEAILQLNSLFTIEPYTTIAIHS